MTVSHSCGLLLRFNEMITSESRASIITLLKVIFELTKKDYKFCLYDDGCHLDESVQAHLEDHLVLKNVTFLIDRFHIKNHVRKVMFLYAYAFYSNHFFKISIMKVCKTKYNPYLQSQLANINSQACEQSYSLLIKYRYTVKHMSKNHFNFFFLNVFDGLNEKSLRRMTKSKNSKR